MNTVDPRFTQAKKNAQSRRRRGLAKRIGIPIAIVCLLLLGGGAYFIFAWLPKGPADDVEIAETAVEPTAVFTPAFVDIAGDPLTIQLGDDNDAARTTREIPRTNSFAYDRAPGNLQLVTDAMVSSDEHFITTLPSSQEDFAFFMAQRKTDITAIVSTKTATTASQPVAANAADAEIFEGNAGWGETLDHENEALPDFKETAVENTTSIAFVRSEQQRNKPFEDVFIKIKIDRDIADILKSNKIDETQIETIVAAAKEDFEIEALGPQNVVAIRGIYRPGGGAALSFGQMSIYTSDSYIGTLAMDDSGSITVGSDPWVQDDLFNYAGDETGGQATQQYRMLDAFYSAAIRNRVPASLVGESILMLSKSHDLDAFANPDDRMTLLYSKEATADGTGPGQILYAAINGSSVDIKCFVFKSPTAPDYACFNDGRSSGGGSGLPNGMTAPVAGVITSKFGPRFHPIHKTVRVHNGVDWAAPTGTPVLAAFAGEVSFAGDGRSYGNLVRIVHPDGSESRYAHLNAFSPDRAAGQKVRAGEVIGYVGTTGQSTGPHLHFELYRGGTAVDPLVGGGSVAGDGSAVDILTDKIIRVESGGDANAKNPLSSATGLGQFIESTWLRMMKTYRPDLSSTLTRPELLALRSDPTISRQMVQKLAQESESYLRARGHEITAGRLYLAHFLGTAGADKVLKAAGDAMLIDVVGESVIKANPFLTGKDAAYVEGWAEKKMSGGSGRRAVAVLPPGFAEFKEVVTAMLATPI